MNTRSFHGRLIVGAALTILLALVVAGSGLVWLFQRHIEQREALSLEAKAGELLPGLRLDAADRPVALTRPSDGRFWRPASGLYWQASTKAGVTAARSLAGSVLPLPLDPVDGTWRLHRAAGPFGHRLLVIARQVHPAPNRPPVVVQFAEDDEALAMSLEEFRLETALALCLLWGVLVLAAVVQVRLGLRPFRRIGAELARLQRHPAERLSIAYPREIAPLIAAINALADARARDLDRARRRAADLAHSLKTPLAALAAQSRRARAEGAPQAADAIDRTIAVAQAALETELARARSAIARERDEPAHAAISATLEAVLAVIERTDRGGQIAFDVDVSSDLTAPVGAADLAEVLGALIENAVCHAHRRVVLAASASDGHVTIRISDDGPGMQSSRFSQALMRGGRLDEAGPGHGLGLAIATDLVAATGGIMALGSAPVGGLMVELSWPDLKPCRST